MGKLHVKVVSPDQTVYEGDAAALVAPAWDGSLGVLPGHAPMIALVGQGELVVDKVGGGSVTVHVAGGALKVEDDQVIVLTEYAGEEPPTELPDDTVVAPEDIGSDTSWATPGDPLT